VFIFCSDEDLKTCVKPSACSCRHNDVVYKPGDEISPDTCNACTCTDGSWSCTEKACSAECSAVGDSHYTSFDGLEYTFQVIRSDLEWF